jgi:hypothetical protein
MSKEVVSPLRQRMIEDMNARKLGAHSQRGHIYSCRRLTTLALRCRGGGRYGSHRLAPAFRANGSARISLLLGGVGIRLPRLQT